LEREFECLEQGVGAIPAEILRSHRSGHSKGANAGRDPRRSDLGAHERNLIQFASLAMCTTGIAPGGARPGSGRAPRPRLARRFAATNLAIGSMAAVCWTVVTAPASLASAASISGLFSH